MCLQRRRNKNLILHHKVITIAIASFRHDLAPCQNQDEAAQKESALEK